MIKQAGMRVISVGHFTDKPQKRSMPHVLPIQVLDFCKMSLLELEKKELTF